MQNESNERNAADSPAPSQGSSPHKKPVALIASVLIVLVVLLVVGILPRLQRNTALAQSVKQAKTSVPQVTVISPEWVSEGSLNLPGNIQAIKETTINARSSGYLRQLYVDIGSRVKAGQLLAEIESPDVDQQGFQAEAQTAQSRAVVGQSKATVAQQRATVVQAGADVSRQRAAV